MNLGWIPFISIKSRNPWACIDSVRIQIPKPNYIVPNYCSERLEGEAAGFLCDGRLLHIMQGVSCIWFMALVYYALKKLFLRIDMGLTSSENSEVSRCRFPGMYPSYWSSRNEILNLYKSQGVSEEKGFRRVARWITGAGMRSLTDRGLRWN